MALRKSPHPERDPERSEGEQSKDATLAIRVFQPTNWRAWTANDDCDQRSDSASQLPLDAPGEPN
jgi:hypothetical protein